VNPTSQILQVWADNLNRWGINNLAAAFLDALGPLTLLGAQFVYIGQPFLNPFIPEDHLETLVNLLENPQVAKKFVAVLRQTEDHSTI
jgi:hypothetical protein